MFGSYINHASNKGLQNAQEKNYRNANILVSDSILNYLTVASFGHEEIIVSKTMKFLKENVVKSFFKNQLIGVIVGFSDFVQYAVYMVVFWSAGAFIRDSKVATEATDIFTAIFVIMFGAYSAGSAKQYGPSSGKGISAAKKIFTICDVQGKIDPFEERLDSPVFIYKD